MIREISIRFFLFIYFKIVYHITFEGVENIPKSGPYILYANHTSNCDPVAVQLKIYGRKVRFMGKKELFKNPIARWYFYKVGVFPVDRESPTGATKKALQFLKQGEILGIFPEGTRNKEGKSLDEVEIHSGLAAIANKTKVPLLPVTVIGSGKPFTKIKVIYHKVKNIEDYTKLYSNKKLSHDDYAAISRQLMKEVYEKKQNLS